MYSTPILFLVFNRLEPTERVFAKIKEQRPTHLFVAQDGPRVGNSTDLEGVESVRQLIEDGLDWPCEVRTLYRDENLGCGIAVSEAISWFFDHVEEGIILEDDCLPSGSFFSFCSEMLDKYRSDEKVFSICGSNLTPEYSEHGKDYFFSSQGNVWGWASWRRAWSKYKFKLPSKLSENALESLVRCSFFPHVVEARLQNFEEAIEIDTWDYQWRYAHIVNRAFYVIPRLNLVSNIGFGACGTHTTDATHPLANLVVNDFKVNFVRKGEVALDEEFEKNFIRIKYPLIKPKGLLVRAYEYLYLGIRARWIRLLNVLKKR